MIFKYKIVERSELSASQKKIDTLQNEIESATEYVKSIGSENAELLLVTEKGDSGLLNELKQLQHKLHYIAEEEKQRNWSSEGLAAFAQLLRTNENNLSELASLLLSKLVNYINAVQASLFVLTDESSANPYLELIACYAYNRKKHFTRRIEIGEGLVGQTFLEKETTLLTDVPDNYISITSGLGEAPPKAIVLIPLIYNEQVTGILEIASFAVFPPYVIQFLEKTGENIASAFSSVKSTETTKKLLEETQIQTEQMKAQEEEMRQNLEELQATQEEINRKQIQIDQKSQLMQLILDNIPVPTFVKDENGKYTLINKAEADILGYHETEVIGKDDTFFTKDEKERQAIRESDYRALRSDIPTELPAQDFTAPNGKKYTFKTTKVSFVNNQTGKRNIIGVSIDLSDRRKLEQSLHAAQVIQQNNVLIDLAGRQRMLSQKIGFYAEMIFRGKNKHALNLEKAIRLHDQSLKVIIEGGIPPEMDTETPLEKAPPELSLHLEEIEKLWNPYKTAGLNIVLIASQPNPNKAEMESTIEIIEDLGEKLLAKNNQLVLAYKLLMEKQLTYLR